MDTIPVHILDCKVLIFIKNDGSWWWDQFEHLLPNNIILQIAAVLPPSPCMVRTPVFGLTLERGCSLLNRLI